MKRTMIYTLLLVVGCCFGACGVNDDIDTSKSIFDTAPAHTPNELDAWLLANYVHPYNIQLQYRLDDKETSVNYDLVPATYENSVALSRIVKHVWLEAYDEVWGVNMTRQYVPKLIQFIGNVAYTGSGAILGQAEGGMKVSLFRVNALNVNSIDIADLNRYYFLTMHHEFIHILNQRNAYDPAYEQISESHYVGSSWYQVDLGTALQQGFISSYSTDRASEDFAEIMATYVVNDASVWNGLLDIAGDTGRPIIEKKLSMVKGYMSNFWDIDLDELRAIVQRRQREVAELDLTTF